LKENGAPGIFAKTGKDILVDWSAGRWSAFSVPSGAGQTLSGRFNGGGKYQSLLGEFKKQGDRVTALEQMRNPDKNNP
jgi:hypothetical protein